VPHEFGVVTSKLCAQLWQRHGVHWPLVLADGGEAEIKHLGNEIGILSSVV
jgi:hypothetical protein